MMMDLQRSHKGFLFTLDAVFALIVASLGISILLYVHYTNDAQFIQTSLEATSVLNNLVQTTVGYAGTGSQLASYLSSSGNSAGSTWPQFAHDQALSGSTNFAPPPYLIYNYTASSTIAPPYANVGDGIAVFTVGTSVYAINATTGTVLPNFPVTVAGAASAPIVYNNRIILSTWTSGCTPCTLTELGKTGNVIWSTSTGYAVSSYSSLQVEGGYIAYSCSGVNLCISNLVNGSLVGVISATPLSVQPPAYANGQYIVATSTAGSQNYLIGYSLISSGIAQNWRTMLSTSATTNPVIVGNEIAVGSGSSLYITTLGGVLLKTVAVTGTAKGIAGSGSSIYLQTSAGVYGFNATGTQIFSHATPTDTYNITPSVAGSTLYTLINGQIFQGYNVNTGQQLWNFTMPSAPYSPAGTQYYNNVALAYGNAYVADASMLYAFGTYKAKPSDNILQTLAAMYLNGQGGYANIMLSKLYPAQNVGLYINSTYAPDLQVATFNGVSSYITTPPVMQPQNHTVVLWMETNSPRTSPVQSMVSMWGSFNAHIGIYGSGSGITFNRNAGGSISSGVVPVVGQWYQVAVTLDKDKIASIYVNGALKGTGVAPSSNEVWSTKDIIGSDVSPPSNAFSGQLADVQFYNSTLSSGQIQQLYSQGIFGQPLSASKLVGWWPLDGNGNDYSGSFNTGLPSNMVYQTSAYLPGSLLNSYQVSKATVPVTLPSNGINSFYNVSVVIWK